MSKTKYILAVDLGTSGPKSALVTMDGDVVGVEQKPVELQLLPNGGAEQSPDEWWQAILSTSKKLVASGLAPAEDIVAISCTSQWSGTVAVDKNGNALGNAIIWMDTRGSRYIDQMTDGPVKIAGYDIWKLIRWLRLTGGIPGHAGKDPIAHILFLKHERPEIYRNTDKFLEPKDYINLKLTGKTAATVDSITLHWLTDNRDLTRVDYDQRLLDMAGVARQRFPDLKNAVDILGPVKKEIARELGINDDAQVVAGTPDVMSAAIGSGAVRDFHGHLYVGTSSWLTCHVPFKKADVFHNMASLPSAIPGKYIIGNEQETAGACLNFIKDRILYPNVEKTEGGQAPDGYKFLDEMAAAAPAGSGRVIFTPWLYGERTPIEDHTVRAGFFNVSLKTTREHLVRAVFEGVAYNSRWLLGYVEKFIKKRMDPIHFIGGGASSGVWCQIFADVLNRNIKQVKDPIQANVRGAAFLASVALGHLTFDDIPDRVQFINTYTPNPENRMCYDRLFKGFLKIYKTNRSFFKQMNPDE